MAGIKHEEKFHFPSGHIWVLMDDEWGVEITGEDGIGGDLVGVGSWDFAPRDSWTAWGDLCIEQIKEMKSMFDKGLATEDEVINKIYQLEEDYMTATIWNDLSED